MNDDCLHCGSPIPPGATTAFCCTGCDHVYALIRNAGLGKFYELRGGPVAPVSAAILEPKDFLPLVSKIAAQESAPGPKEIRLGLRGLSCIGCVWLVEKLVEEQPGILEGAVNAHTGSIRLRWNAGRFDIEPLATRLHTFGYLITPEVPETSRAGDGLTLRLGLCGAFAMNAMLNTVPSYLGMQDGEAYSGVFRLLTVGFATLSMLVGGSLFIGRALASLRLGALHMDLPIALGLVAAYLASFAGWFLRVPQLEYWDFVCLFTFLMLAGRAVQERAVERNRLRLPELNPVPATVPVYASEIAAEPERRAAPDRLARGDILGIAPGGVLPVSGRVLGDGAALSLAWINGESEPVTHPFGHLAPAGATNLSASELRIRAEEDWSESMLRRLLDAGGDGAYTPKILRRVLGSYLTVVMIVGASGFFARGFLTDDWPAALQSAVSVLVVSCPCAIGLAFPLATEMAVAQLRRGGVYVRDNRVWERVSRVRRVVFDKTGTLSPELPVPEHPERLAELSSQERAALFRLVENNLHPVGRALREALSAYPESRDAEKLPAGRIVETVGRGVGFTDEHGTAWFLGKPVGNDGDTDAELRHDDRVVARFTFRETPRPGAAEEVRRFESRGRPVQVLSGDRPEKVAAMMRALGLPESRGLGGLSPNDKAAWIDAHDGESCLMVGDGANDAPAFARAGLRGTPVVDRGLLEQKADFYLLGRGLSGLGLLFDVAARRTAVLRVVFTFAVVYNLAVAALALAGRMSPLLATVLMPAGAIITLTLVTRGMSRGLRNH